MAEEAVNIPETPEVQETPETGAFYSSLSPEYQEDATIKNLSKADNDTIAKTLVNQAKMVGADKIIMPKEGDAEGLRDVFTKLGYPGEASKYELDAVDENLAKQIGFSQDAYKDLINVARGASDFWKDTIVSYEPDPT